MSKARFLHDWYITERQDGMREIHGSSEGELIEPAVVKDVTERFTFAWCQKENFHLRDPVYGRGIKE